MPIRSAAAENSGQRVSVSVSAQMTVCPLATTSMRGPAPAATCTATSQDASGWLAACVPSSPSRQTVTFAAAQPGTWAAASAVSWLSELSSVAAARLSNAAVRSARSELGTCYLPLRGSPLSAVLAWASSASATVSYSVSLSAKPVIQSVLVYRYLAPA